MIWSNFCAAPAGMGRIEMKAMLAAFVVTAVIAVGADLVLEGMGFSAEAANTGNAVRLGAAAE